MSRIDRREYVSMYGPSVGDQVRLGDTDLWIEVEEDRTVGGNESGFGGGKAIRESMGQALTTRSEGALDLVITNVVVLDHWGIVRGDVGVRDGRIVAVGKSGNPDIMDGVHPDLIIGPGTDVIAGEGKILTAGAIDTHVHYLHEVEMLEALATGTTTVTGGGTGPTEGSKATTVTPGAWSLAMMHRAFDHLPLNVILFSKGNTVSTKALEEDARAGAGGYKVHEDWGATPAALDAALRAVETTGLQVALHADSLNETGYVQHTMDAIAGRGIHIFHSEGAGGGHAPDIIVVAGESNVLPASTNPTLPHTVNTEAEHLDMLMVCHHLNPRIPEDLAFAESRIRGTTMAAEDILQDMGAISITSSDAQADGPDRGADLAHLAGRPRHEAAAGLPRLLAAGGQRARPPLCGQVHDLPGRRPRRRPRDRLDRTRQDGRPRAVGPRLLRHPSRLGHQGRGDRQRRPRRPERRHPDAAAGLHAPDLPLGPRLGAAPGDLLRLPAGHRGRPR